MRAGVLGKVMSEKLTPELRLKLQLLRDYQNAELRCWKAHMTAGTPLQVYYQSRPVVSKGDLLISKRRIKAKGLRP
jgi:hypothetical protein